MRTHTTVHIRMPQNHCKEHLPLQQRMPPVAATVNPSCQRELTVTTASNNRQTRWLSSWTWRKMPCYYCCGPTPEPREGSAPQPPVEPGDRSAKANQCDLYHGAPGIDKGHLTQTPHTQMAESWQVGGIPATLWNTRRYQLVGVGTPVATPQRSVCPLWISGDRLGAPSPGRVAASPVPDGRLASAEACPLGGALVASSVWMPGELVSWKFLPVAPQSVYPPVHTPRCRHTRH